MKRLLLGVVLVALGPALTLRSASQSSDDLARRQFDSGVAFLQNGRYVEALKDFEAVVASFPQSTVADDALLQIALYQLEVERDHAAAQAAADRLLKEYAGSDSAPMAYVISGRLAIAKSRTPADAEGALATFERVPRLFPNSPAVAAARFYAGETLRLTRRSDDAVQQYWRVAIEHPQSIWAARANLAAAASLVASDRAVDAFGSLQRIRQQFPGTREAAAALNLNTIIYRLLVKKPPPYASSGRFVGGEKDRFRDVVGVKVDDAGRILVGHRLGVSIFDPKGTLARHVAATEPSGFFVAGGDRITVVRRDVVLRDGLPPVAITVPVAGRVPRQVEEMVTAVTLSSGEWLIADRRAKTVLRISPAGNFIANFAGVNAERMARNEFDDVAMIDRDNNSIVIADPSGRLLTRILPKGAGYQLEDPVDVAFDPLGHLYVLDGRRAAIHVFGRGNRLMTTVTFAGREGGGLQKPRAIALDAAGRLYVYDEGSQRIQVYQ